MTRKFACAVALLFAVACLSPLSAGAAAAKGTLRIVSPTPESLVRGNRLVVRTKVGADVSHLRLRIAGRDLRMRTSEGTDGLRTGAVSVRGLPRGRVALSVSGRVRGHRLYRFRPIILGRRSPGLLRGVDLPRRAAGAVRLKLRLGGRISAFRVTVDGRPARLLHRPDQPPPARPAIGSSRARVGSMSVAPVTTIPLSADDGLHPGRNRVVVLAYRARTGRWAMATRTVWMSRRVPLVAAGRDRRIVSGTTLRLGGSHSRPAHAGERLRYRWRIVSRPKLQTPGHPARLIHPRTAHPRLVVNRAGTYKVALSLADPGTRAGAGRRATASSVGSSPDPSDVMTVDAAASAPPYGLRLSTRQQAEPAGMYGEGTMRTTINGVPLEVEGNDFVEAGEDETLLLILNRATLAVEKVEIGEVEAEAQMSALIAEANATTSDQMAILTGVCGCTMTVPQEPGVPLSAGFTFVVAGGHMVAYNVGNELGAGSPGAMQGVLRRQSDGGDYTFVYPELFEFDTLVEPAENHFAINLGGNQIPVQPTGGDTEAIEIATLDPALEQVPTLCATFSLKGNSEDESTLREVAELLGEIVAKDPHGVLLLQTLGNPKPETAAWGEIGQELENFGGTPSVWDTLDGTGNYSLVGTVYGSQETAELRQVSTMEASGPLEGTEAAQSLKRWVGTARGILGRGQNGLPVVRAATSLPGGTDSTGQAINPDGLALLAEEPPAPWPLSDPPHEAALAWVSRHLGPDGANDEPTGLGNPAEASINWCYAPSEWDVRAEYCNTNLTGNWGEYAGQLADLHCPEGEAGFTAADCGEVIEQLKREFGDLGLVNKLIEQLKEPFQNSKTAVATAFVDGGEKVEREVVRPVEGENGFPVNAEDIIDSVTGPAQDYDFKDAEGVVEDGESDGAALVLGLIEAGINLGLEYAEGEDGEPAAAPFFVPDKAQISTEAVKRLTEASNGIGALEDLLVTDWHKLSTTAQNATTSWSLNQGAIAAQTEHIEAGAEALAYETMVPPSYEQLEVVPEGGLDFSKLRGIFCERSEVKSRINVKHEEWEPFEAVSESGAFLPATGTDATGSPLHTHYWVIANTSSKYAEVPAEALTKNMFTPSTSKGAGIYPAPFFTWNWLGKRKDFAKFWGPDRTEKGLNSPNECTR